MGHPVAGGGSTERARVWYAGPSPKTTAEDHVVHGGQGHTGETTIFISLDFGNLPAVPGGTLMCTLSQFKPEIED